MDRSRRGEAKAAGTRPPPSSRLTFKPGRNRKRPESLWARLPAPAVITDACGRALRRAVPAAVAMAVVGAVGGTAWAGYRFVTTSPRFAIDHIEVRGNHHVSADQVRAALPVHVGDNVFATDPDTVTGELRDNPWVASAEAHRVLPHTLVIDVREHEPAAVAELGGLYLVDADGHAFKRAALADGDGAGLPVITGIDRAAYLADRDAAAALVRDALAALAAWRASDRPAIGEIHIDAHGAVTLHTYDQGTAIALGTSADLAPRLRTFDAAWAELSDAERARARAVHIAAPHTSDASGHAGASPDQVTIAFSDKDQ